jgi:hypothetical protein
MEEVKKFFNNKYVKTGMWQLANGIISLAIVYITGENLAYAAVLVPILNFCTKFINKEFLS